MSTGATGRPRVLLDVDTGIDDALALLYAVAEPRLDLVGVTTVVGNVPVDVAARNTAAVLAAAGAARVPVTVGAAATAGGRGHRDGPTNHGPDGLGGVAVSAPAARPPTSEPPTALLDRIAPAGPISVAACAPLTNVADLVEQPAVVRVVMVGGELAPAPEPAFNVGPDAPTAVRVLAAPPALTVYTADVFETVAVPAAVVRRLQGSSALAGRLAGELLAVRRGHLLGDAGALVLMARPDLFDVRLVRMAVVEDQLVPSEAGREVEVVVGAHVPAVVDAFVSAVAG